MKRVLFLFIVGMFASLCATAQIMIKEGELEESNIKWSFDGRKLTLTSTSKKGGLVEMENFGTKFPAPWTKKKFKVEIVHIGAGIKNIGACAFYGNKNIKEVVFESNDVREIGWGAFLGCEQLKNISFPNSLKNIGEAAFANCSSLVTINIPNQCHLGDMSFLSCTGLTKIILDRNVIVGADAFSTESLSGNTYTYSQSKAQVENCPANITKENCAHYGLKVEKSIINIDDIDDPYKEISDVDSMIPESKYRDYDTYALIIGNQNYRFATKVPHALHDAIYFEKYCSQALGVPSANIHLVKDATKSMILEDEMEWLNSIPEPENKRLIVYYAGHGVPDINTKKAYLLPTDKRGTHPNTGISLEKFYGEIAALNFHQCSVFLDACFSGDGRVGGVNEGERAAVIIEPDIDKEGIHGNMVVFSAATGGQTAQAYTNQGHGLFTYYLLKSLQYSDGTINFSNLSDELTKSVSEKASDLELHKTQTPTVQYSKDIENKWGKMQLHY